jgi:selenocysteine lyase/cysteine desulfurase
MAEEMFDKYDKMVIAGLHQEYFGSLLFSRGAMSQHEFVARAVAELTGAQQGTREYEDLVAKLTQSVKKLAEWGVIEVKEYEARLTAWGQSVANSISAEEFKKIKDELAKEASRKRR